MTYEETLFRLAVENESIVVMTAENRGPIRNLAERLGERFIDFGICEQTMVGAAAGLALRGRIPVVHALAAFLTMRSFEFIRTDVGIGGLPVKFVGGVPGFLSDANGPTHQAVEDIALMRSIPGMEIFCPADEEELIDGLPEVIRRPHPCYIRFNASPPFVRHAGAVRFGQAEIINNGTDVSIVTYGFMLKETVCAAEMVAAKGISCRIINLRTIKPIDEASIVSAARETGMIVAVEDHFRTGGLYSIIGEILMEHRTACPVFSCSLKERWFRPALLPDVLAYEGFTGERIAAKIGEAWNSI
jgi:transketolase